MENYSTFKFNNTYLLAGDVRNLVLENSPNEYLEDYFDVTDVDFQSKLLRSTKWTTLHEFILIRFCSNVEYLTSKIGTRDTEEEWEDLLEDYNVTYPDQEQYEEDDDRDYSYVQELSMLVCEKVGPKVTEEVFTLLFADRMFLLKFNELIASKIVDLEINDYPLLLERDGVIKRQKYFSAWVKMAVFYRDRGCCAVCLTDLSGLLRTGFRKAIDHIVPLNLGGSNDITNFQLICQTCNLKKLGHTTMTSELYPRYF